MLSPVSFSACACAFEKCSENEDSKQMVMYTDRYIYAYADWKKINTLSLMLIHKIFLLYVFK